MNFRILLLIIVGLIATCTLGCKKSGPPRHDAAGVAYYQGTEIKKGFVMFVPDVLKGGSGPAGRAFITDGKFDTRDSQGKGVSPGPQIISVTGFDGVNITDDLPYGKPIFPTYSFSQVFDKAELEMKIEVPKKP